MPVHARLSPSKGDLWTTCPGGVPFAEANSHLLVTKDVVSPTGVAALGTIAHSYAERLIMSMLDPDEDARETFRREASDLADQLPPELVANAETYASWATQFVMTRPDLPWGLELGAELWYEPGSKGYADFWAIDKTELVVVDYKSGRLPVYAQNNVQIGIYLLAIYDAVKQFNPQIKKFRAGIMQPFSARNAKPEPVWWELNLEELERFRDFVSAAAYEVDHPVNGQARLVVSEKGCRWCPAKAICPAQAEGVDSFAGLMQEEPEALEGARLYDIFRRRRSVRDFLDKVEDYIRDQPDEVLTANALERKPGNMRREWKKTEAETVAALESLGVDAFKKVLKTPAQVEKELDSSAIESMIAIDFNRPQIVDTKPVAKTFRVSRKG